MMVVPPGYRTGRLRVDAVPTPPQRTDHHTLPQGLRSNSWATREWSRAFPLCSLEKASGTWTKPTRERNLSREDHCAYVAQFLKPGGRAHSWGTWEMGGGLAESVFHLGTADDIKGRARPFSWYTSIPGTSKTCGSVESQGLVE